MINLVSKVI